MATYRELGDGPAVLRIEVEPNGGTGGNLSIGGLVEAIRAVAALATQQVSQLPAEQRPTDLRISFGIRALENGYFAVGLEEDSANFHVTLAWSQEPSPALPEMPEPELPAS
jgi:hypothetical protein